MKKYCIILGLLCFLSIKASAQKLSVVISYTTAPGLPDEESFIFYKPHKNLRWTDFKGIADENSIAAALTDAGFGYFLSYSSENGGTLSVGVYCDFNKNNSWFKPQGKNAYILKHEQHHFDIAYICTMQFIHNLRKIKYTSSNYEQAIKDAYQTCAATMDSMQNQYDTETQHGIVRDKQQEWSDKIDKQLAALNTAE